MINPYFVLRLNKTDKKNGIAVVYLLIKIKDDTAKRFSTNVKCHPSQWNYKNHRIDGNTENIKEQNRYLDYLDTEVKRIYRNLIEQNKSVNAQLVADICRKKEEKIPTFLNLFTELINLKVIDKTESTIKCNKNHQKIFVEFLQSINKNDLELTEINNMIVDKLCNYLTEKRVSNGFYNNAIYTYSSVINRANNLGYVQGNPFKNVKRKKIKEKEFIYLNSEQLEYLINLNLDSLELQNSLNAFLFQCFTGVSIIDLRAFRKSINIHDNKIIINRKKNNQGCYIPIIKECRIILDRLKTDSFGVPFDYIYNNYTKIFATLCKHPQAELFTSHVGRKTNGMFLLSKGIRLQTVSKVLGHSDIRVTQKIYTKILNSDIDNEFKDLI